MKKTTLYLEPDLDRAVARLAAKRGVSKAEAIRAALREATGRVERPRITAIGVGRGPGDVADNVDRHLAETDFARR
jgi:predicted transcriptional regulator